MVPACYRNEKMVIFAMVMDYDKSVQRVLCFCSHLLAHAFHIPSGSQHEEYVKKEGYAVYGHDMIGHGFSEGTRWLIPGSAETNVNDNVAFCNLVASFHEDDIPIILMGESYGCTVTILTARKFQDKPRCGPKNFDSIILTAPAIIGDLPAYPVYLLLRYVLAPNFPAWTPFFSPRPVSPESIWKDPEVLALRTSPRFKEMMLDGSGRPLRLGTRLSMVVAMDKVRKQMPGFKLPYCIVHGTEDAAVLIAGSEYMWDKAGSEHIWDKAAIIEDKVFKRQEGAYHDLLADPTAEDSMQVTIDFIKKRIAARKFFGWWTGIC
jgi:alpha-beta hydrolase superfamily lysophospholipase